MKCLPRTLERVTPANALSHPERGRPASAVSGSFTPLRDTLPPEYAALERHVMVEHPWCPAGTRCPESQRLIETLDKKWGRL